jgi:SAM-dependent methyltransferase
VHLSSLDNMRMCLKKHVLPDPALRARSPLRVLEVGASEFTTGNYRSAMASLRADYIGVDIESGDGVDLVLDDPYVLPFDDESFDIVVSGQTFEHNEQFWRTFAEMTRVLSPHGVMIAIAPSAGPEHRFPVDCYRFLPDTMQALANASGLTLVDHWVSDFGPWHDNVGVFRHPGFEPSLATLQPDLSVEPTAELQNSFPDDLPDEIEHGAGVEWKYHLLERVHEHLDPRFYLEIGVFDGASLVLASCDAVGIDPQPVLTHELRPNHRISHTTSDDFFRLTSEPAGLPVVDLAYIDGMHLAEFVLKDFMNVEQHCNRFSVVVIDDIYPAHPLQAERVRQSRFWTGDVWKVIPLLRGARPDLILLPIDTEPTGTLLILGLDPTNTAVWSRFDIFVEWVMSSMTEVHPDILGRDDKIDPFDPLIPRVLGMLREARQADALHPGAGDPMLDRIRHLVAGALPRKVGAR